MLNISSIICSSFLHFFRYKLQLLPLWIHHAAQTCSWQVPRFELHCLNYSNWKCNTHPHPHTPKKVWGCSCTNNSHVINWKCEIQSKEISIFGLSLYKQFSCCQLEMWNLIQRNLYFLGCPYTSNSHVLQKCEKIMFLGCPGTKKPSYISGFTINCLVYW